MPDQPPPAPAPAPKPSRSKRAKPGFIDQDLEDAIELAGNCQREAAKPEVTPGLADREWLPADGTALEASLGRCAAFQQQLRELRTGARTRTDEEDAARIELLAALDPVIKGARRKYPDGSAERRAYGIGARLSSASTQDLLNAARYAAGELAPGPRNAPPKDTLKGVKPEEIVALGQLVEKYQQAGWAQADTQQQSARLLAQLRLEVETVLNPLRRDLQGAADQAFTHRDKTNAAQRQAFGLQADRSLHT